MAADPTPVDTLAGRDHDDLFPWTYKQWPESEHGSICSPNGTRPDGTPHTYWMIAGEVWPPDGHLICEAVNAWVRPGWRARLGRWLLTRGAPVVGGGNDAR